MALTTDEMNAREISRQTDLSPAEIALLPAVGAHLGWLDITLKADGEHFNIEMQVTGRFEAQWIGEPKTLVIEGVYLCGADCRVNILAALTPQMLRAIENEIRPQAKLLEDNPQLGADLIPPNRDDVVSW